MAKNKPRAKKISVLVIAVLSILTVIIAAVLFLEVQTRKNSVYETPLSSNIPNSATSPDEVFQSTRSYLSDVFNNKVTFGPRYGANTVESAEKTIGIVPGVKGWSVDIYSFKYQKDKAVFEAIKESSSKKIDLNKEIANYFKMKLGEQRLFTCASLSGCGVWDVTGHKLGSKIWGSIDMYHIEGGGWSTTYYSYDEDNHIVSYVNIYFYGVDKHDYVYGVTNTHPEVVSILKQFEKEALTF